VRSARRTTNRTVPPTTPAMNTAAIAITCSASFAMSEVGPRFNVRITDTIVPMPKAMRGPGSTLVSQSKISKGTNGSPATLQPKNSVPINAIVTSEAAKRPFNTPGVRESFILLNLGCSARSLHLFAEEVLHVASDLAAIFFKSEVAGVEEMEFEVLPVAFVSDRHSLFLLSHGVSASNRESKMKRTQKLKMILRKGSRRW